jgi:hypothetical protein
MVMLGRRWARDLALAGAEPVGEGEERVACGARRGRCCCGDRCRSCVLDLRLFMSVLFFLTQCLPKSPFHVKEGGE